MEQDDDWVSASPIKLGSHAAAQSFTPGRELSRQEVRQQRRRGGPISFSKAQPQAIPPMVSLQATHAARPEEVSPTSIQTLDQAGRRIVSSLRGCTEPPASRPNHGTKLAAGKRAATSEARTLARVQTSLEFVQSRFGHRHSPVDTGQPGAPVPTAVGNQQSNSIRDDPSSDGFRFSHPTRSDGFDILGHPASHEIDGVNDIKYDGVRSIVSTTPRKAGIKLDTGASDDRPKPAQFDNISDGAVPEVGHPPDDRLSASLLSRSAECVNIGHAEPAEYVASKIDRQDRDILEKRNATDQGDRGILVKKPRFNAVEQQARQEDLATINHEGRPVRIADDSRASVEDNRLAEQHPHNPPAGDDDRLVRPTIQDCFQASWNSIQERLRAQISDICGGRAGESLTKLQAHLDDAHSDQMQSIPLVQQRYSQLDALRGDCEHIASQLRLLDRQATATAGRLRRQVTGWAASRKVWQLQVALSLHEAALDE